MEQTMEKLLRAKEYITAKTDLVPQAALVLGSGLGAVVDDMQIQAAIPFDEIPGFPVSTVTGHSGRLVLGMLSGVRVAVMQGRVHYYEGYAMQDVVMPIRLLAMLGAKILVLTNAAGGINPEFSAGDFMLLRGQIGCFVPSPLIGENLDALGTRFPDMSAVYDEQLRACVKKAKPDIREGVYIQFSGPQYETPEEIRMAGLLGADAVGMSTACEAIAARHAGMRVCGISCISNMAAGVQKTPLSHSEVMETAQKIMPEFKDLLINTVKEIGGIL